MVNDEGKGRPDLLLLVYLWLTTTFQRVNVTCCLAALANHFLCTYTVTRIACDKNILLEVSTWSSSTLSPKTSHTACMPTVTCIVCHQIGPSKVSTPFAEGGIRPVTDSISSVKAQGVSTNLASAHFTKIALVVHRDLHVHSVTFQHYWPCAEHIRSLPTMGSA
jgi:hypothetical protein